MDAWLSLLGTWPGGRWLQGSGTAYLFVNTVHLLGLALLLGAIVPLDLRLAGGLRGEGLPLLARALSRTAAAGLALALPTGLWLFSVRPVDYADNPAFLYKLALLFLALLNVAWQHAAPGWRAVLGGAPPTAGVRWRARLSLLLWLGVLLAGRWIGFL
ncbi:DUF2214 domain-containing protein [Xenophilus sp. Marseille-Q4582]|uniref:DUF2214 domain-containing protein n=1 Tax=Xenophilus sp. Marseille-Q4582 TaxID=2866600 RepID=UPI001CE4429F|nr:DUF2214 domain-containing protein [Xenophilus sp. Marseille-Q4582]